MAGTLSCGDVARPVQRRLARNCRSTRAASSCPISSDADRSVAAGTESSGSARAGAYRPKPTRWPGFCDLDRSSGPPRSGRWRALRVDWHMRTNLTNVLAAGDCVETWHRLLNRPAYLPLGTTAHKQGRVAEETAVGGDREFAGSLGTQVVKVFELAVARTGLRDQEAAAAGLDPLTVGSTLRPQGVLPGRPPAAAAHHRGPHDRAAPRRPAGLSPRRRGRQAHRHPRRRPVPRHDRRGPVRLGPELHAAIWQSLRCGADGRPDLDS